MTASGGQCRRPFRETGSMPMDERPEELEARKLVETALCVELTHADKTGGVDYLFATAAGRFAALEVTTVTDSGRKIARDKWTKESPQYRAATSLHMCWEVWLDDVDVKYRGLVARLEPHIAVLEASGRTFDSRKLHQFIGAPASEQDAATAIAREHVEQASPRLDLCAMRATGHEHRIEIVRVSGWAASGSDSALSLIEEELNGRADNGAKLREAGADECHLFVWVDRDTDLAVARPFRGGQAAKWPHFGLPSRAPGLNDPVDQLWILDRTTLTGWVWSATGWETFEGRKNCDSRQLSAADEN